MTRDQVTQRVRSFIRQPDVRANPGRALVRRLRWRAHWKAAPTTPFTIRRWTHGLSIQLPHTGAAAQIYYRTFSSPRLASVLTASLSPGMHFLDVGAHVGEYSLLAAALVGQAGKVTAIEPQPDLASVIRRNAVRNALSNVEVHQVALADRPQRLSLATDQRSGGAWLAHATETGGAVVDCVALESILADCAPIDLAKLDAGGNEASVLASTRESLAAGTLPTIVYKLYHPDVVASRFGSDGVEGHSIVAMLGALGYEQVLLVEAPRAIITAEDVLEVMGSSWYSVPVFARRAPAQRRQSSEVR